MPDGYVVAKPLDNGFVEHVACQPQPGMSENLRAVGAANAVSPDGVASAGSGGALSLLAYLSMFVLLLVNRKLYQKVLPY